MNLTFSKKKNWQDESSKEIRYIELQKIFRKYANMPREVLLQDLISYIYLYETVCDRLDIIQQNVKNIIEFTSVDDELSQDIYQIINYRDRNDKYNFFTRIGDMIKSMTLPSTEDYIRVGMIDNDLKNSKKLGFFEKIKRIFKREPVQDGKSLLSEQILAKSKIKKIKGV